MDGFRDIAEVGGNVVFEALAADVLQELLQMSNFRHAGAAESLQWIVGEPARAGVPANDAATIVSGITRKAHVAGLDAAHARSEGVQLAHRAGDDGLVIHFYF